MTSTKPTSGGRRFYTPEEANQALPLVRAIVGDVVRQFEQIRDRKERLQEMRRRSGSHRQDEESPYAEEVRQVEDDLDKEVQNLNAYVEELRELGVELKDFARGLVDFPAMMEGREVCLCWMLGEPEVAYWHETDAGFRGRQSLLEGSAAGFDSEDAAN